MRLTLLTAFALSLAAGGAHAAAKASPKLIKEVRDGGGHVKTYLMPSGRKIEVEPNHPLGLRLTSPSYRVTNLSPNGYLAKYSRTREVRTVQNLRTGTSATQSVAIPQKSAELVGIENMRTQRGGWSDVKLATYRDGARERQIVIPPGASQIEEHPVHINEAAIAKQYLAHQKRQADLEHAFRGKAR